MIKPQYESTHFRPQLRGWQVAALLGVLWIVVGNGLTHTQAQVGENPWTTPVNVSRSGAAQQPLIAGAPDGTFHILWWDAVAGEQYIRTANMTTTAGAPINLTQMVGERQVNDQTRRVTLTAPRQPQLYADARGNAYAFWLDTRNQLQSAQTRATGWTGNIVLADSAATLDAATDLSGTVHLVYVRPTEPAGLYYRSTSGGEWSTPATVYTSPYFRVVKPEEAHVSVAGDGLGRRVVAWDDPRMEQSFYAYSTNSGRTWSNPQPVSTSETDRTGQVHVFSTPSGEFLLLWQDQTKVGCGLNQRRSSDGGQAFSAPERVLASLTRCPGYWRSAPDSSGKMWLIGSPLPDSQISKTGTTILAVWDGKTWMESLEVSIRFREATTGRFVSLGCLGMTVAGRSLGVIGCDANDDVWVARNAIELDRLLPALRPVWAIPKTLSAGTEPGSIQGVPALAADDQGKFYAMWSQSVAEGGPGTAIYVAVGDSVGWTAGVQVLRSPSDATGLASTEATLGKAEQPALVADHQGRLHAVWSGGSSGDIFYSWAYARDAASTKGWATPTQLPAPTRVGSWPDILADPRGDTLHVIYAVPYNEERGIYYVRSDDNGATWLTPTLLFDAVAAKWDSVDKPRLALDARTDTLHAVWLRANLPGGAGRQAMYYSHSTDNGRKWSAPLRVVEGSVDWPRVAVAGTSHVFLVWNQARPGRTSISSVAEAWSQFSSSGGDRWTAPARVSALADINGPVGLTSDGQTAILIGIGQGAGGESTLFQTRWTGQAWGAPETFGLGQNIAPGNAASAAIARPDKLGVVMREWVRQASGEGQIEVRATTRGIASLPAAAPAPTFTPLPTPQASPTVTPRPTATPKPQLAATIVPQGTRSSLLQGQSPLVISGLLAAIIVVGVVIGRIMLVTRR